MNDEEKKRLGAAVVSGGVGFALGWFLHRPKQPTAVQPAIVLSNLTITPNEIRPSIEGPDTVATISVNATNPGTEPQSATVTINNGIQLWEIPITVAPGETELVSVQFSTLVVGLRYPEVSAGINAVKATMGIMFG